MAQVIIRKLDRKVVENLKTKAKFHGWSLEQELREILSQASQLTAEEKLQLADRIRAMSKSRMKEESVELLREDRDAR